MAPEIKTNALILAATLFFSSCSAIVDPNLAPSSSLNDVYNDKDNISPAAAAVGYPPKKEKKLKGAEPIPAGNGEGAPGDLLPSKLRDKIAKEHGHRHENAKLADKKMKDAAGELAVKAKEKFVGDAESEPSEGVIAEDALKEKHKKANKHHLKDEEDKDESIDKPKKPKHQLKDHDDILKEKPIKTRHHLKDDEEAEDALKPKKAKDHTKDEKDEDESKDKPKKAKHGLKEKEDKDALKDKSMKPKKHLKDGEEKVKVKVPKEKKADNGDDKMPKKKKKKKDKEYTHDGDEADVIPN